MKYTLKDNAPIALQLSRNLTRDIKRGQKWVYGNSLRSLPPAPAGSIALLKDNKGGSSIGYGFYNPTDAIPLRMCTSSSENKISDKWASDTMMMAKTRRKGIDTQKTDVYRLFNGEGDNLPGLTCDIYGSNAVIKLDGVSPSGFWNVKGIAEWLIQNIGVTCVYQRFRSKKQKKGEIIYGELPVQPIAVKENDIPIKVNFEKGQKTGMFIDQRENRKLVQSITSGLSVLNVFGYTGGFSVAAGKGGATHVTTVDLAKPAIKLAIENWDYAGLPTDNHEAISVDAFDFLEKTNKKWDLIILDPPSFAPNQASVEKATNAYIKLFTLGAKCVNQNGMIAFSSCSSHISEIKLLEIIQQAVSNARKTATVLKIGNQPIDHPYPLQMPNLRYLKFILCQVY